MAYREFRNENYFKTPELPNAPWVDVAGAFIRGKEQAENLAERKSARKDKQNQDDVDKIKSFNGTSPYATDAREIGEAGVALTDKVSKQGFVAPEDNIKMKQLEAQSNLTKAQKIKQDELQQTIASQDKYFDKGLAQERLTKANADDVNHKNRDETLKIDFNHPDYFQKSIGDAEFMDQQKNNSRTMLNKFEDTGFKTTTEKQTIDKPFIVEDKTKILGQDLSGNPIYGWKAGVSDEHVDQYLDDSTKRGLKTFQKYASKVPITEVQARIKANGHEENDITRAAALEAIVHEKAKSDLEKMNVGKEDFTREVTREKPIRPSAAEVKKQEERPILQRDTVNKIGVGQPVTRTVNGQTSTVYRNQHTGEESTKQIFKDQFTPASYPFGKNAQNMNPMVALRSAKMYSLDNNKEVGKNTSAPQDVEILGVELLPVDKNTGKTFAFKSKEDMDNYMRKNPGSLNFEWSAIGNLKKKVDGKDVEHGVRIPLKHGDANQQVNAVIKQRYGFDLNTRQPEEITEYEKQNSDTPKPSIKDKPKTVTQGGHTYTLNESTGEYE